MFSVINWDLQYLYNNKRVKLSHWRRKMVNYVYRLTEMGIGIGNKSRPICGSKCEWDQNVVMGISGNENGINIRVKHQSLHLNKLVPLIKVTHCQQLLVQHIPSVYSSVSFAPAHLYTQHQSLHLNKLVSLIKVTQRQQVVVQHIPSVSSSVRLMILIYQSISRTVWSLSSPLTASTRGFSTYTSS